MFDISHSTVKSENHLSDRFFSAESDARVQKGPDVSHDDLRAVLLRLRPTSKLVLKVGPRLQRNLRVHEGQEDRGVQVGKAKLI